MLQAYRQVRAFCYGLTVDAAAQKSDGQIFPPQPEFRLRYSRLYGSLLRTFGITDLRGAMSVLPLIASALPLVPGVAGTPPVRVRHHEALPELPIVRNLGQTIMQKPRSSGGAFPNLGWRGPRPVCCGWRSAGWRATYRVRRIGKRGRQVRVDGWRNGERRDSKERSRKQHLDDLHRHISVWVASVKELAFKTEPRINFKLLLFC